MQSAQLNYYRVAWRDIDVAVSNIYQTLDRFRWSPKIVIGIARGGLIPAIKISHGLNIPMATIAMHTYEGTEAKETKLMHPTSGLLLDRTEVEYLNSPEVLLVDDIYDSGRTLEFIDVTLKDCKKATLFSKMDLHDSTRHPISNWIHRGIQVRPTDWVIFPWE